MNVLLDLIDRAPDNPRRKLREIPELAASIEEQGLLQPLVVAPSPSEGRFLLIAGHRRLAALERLGRPTAPAVLVEGEIDAARRLALILTENDQRSPLSAMERAEAYQRMIQEHGLTQAAVARLVGRHPSTINLALQLLKPVEERARELDEYRARRSEGAAQRGRPPLPATVEETMKALERAAAEGGGYLTAAQAHVALRVIEQGAFALTRERARERRAVGVG